MMNYRHVRRHYAAFARRHMYRHWLFAYVRDAAIGSLRHCRLKPPLAPLAAATS